MKNLKLELENLEFEMDILEKTICNFSERKIYDELIKNNQNLPQGVFFSKEYNEYYKIIRNEITDEELKKLITYRQTKYLSRQTALLNLQTECLKSIRN